MIVKIIAGKAFGQSKIAFYDEHSTPYYLLVKHKYDVFQTIYSKSIKEET